MSNIRFRVASLGFFTALGLLLTASSGCRTYVPIHPSRFMPAFDPAPFAMYRGRTLVMRNVENADDNTTIFMYPRSGPRTYGGPLLTSYFWYCFRESFYRIGTRVFDDSTAVPGASIMEMRLLHITEDRFTVDVSVLGGPGQPPFHKRYSIPGPPLPALRQADLEIRAYQMMSLLFLNIASDPQFQAVAIPAGPTY